MTEQQNTPALPGALEDVVVLDLTDEKGMYMGKMLGEMGARVILVEPPGGHPARHIGPFYQDRPDPNGSLLFWYYSTNKESVTLDITNPKGAQILKEMVKRADILLESFQPGYLPSLGLGYEELSQINPGLIMTSLTGFGQTGPYRDMKTSDLVAMAMGGPMASSGYDDVPGAPPIRCDGWVGYSTGSNFGVIGTLTALCYRDQTGQGQWLDVSLYESLACTTEAAMPYWLYAHKVPIRQTGRHHGLTPTPSTQYQTADGTLINGFDIPPRTVAGWDALVAWLDEKGWAGEFKDESWREAIRGGDRTGPHVKAITDHVTKFIASLPADEVYHGAQRIRLAWGVIRSPEENMVDEHFRDDRKFFVPVEHPELQKTFTYSGGCFLSNKTPWRIRRRPPLLGEHNEGIYVEELGLGQQEVVALREARVI